jgi:hypothetical protein
VQAESLAERPQGGEAKRNASLSIKKVEDIVLQALMNPPNLCRGLGCRFLMSIVTAPAIRTSPPTYISTSLQ